VGKPDQEPGWRQADKKVCDNLPAGVKLVRTLRAHAHEISRIGWSPDGRILASPSADATIRLWEAGASECVRTLKGHNSSVNCVAFDPTGHVLASGSEDNTVKLWETASGKLLHTLEAHKSSVFSVRFDPHGRILASGGADEALHLWDAREGRFLRTLDQGSGIVYGLSFDLWGNLLASGHGGGPIKIWRVVDRQCLQTMDGDRAGVSDLTFHPSGSLLASGGGDHAVKVWSVSTGQLIRVLEHHTNVVHGVSFSGDGRLLASGSRGGDVCIWRCDTWHRVAVISEASTHSGRPGLAFHPYLPILATTGSDPGTARQESGRVTHLYELDLTVLLGLPTTPTVAYASAKVVLVGDSGVGKTGLGWRLAHGEFKEHASTHGQQFWVIPQLGLKRKDGTNCEAVLWDLAGQHVYRQIHSIFLENVAAALVLFDPSNRQDPLKGVQFWLEQLKGKGQLPPAILVGARVDRGAPALSQQELEQFCQRYGIRGGYLSTSAKSSDGMDRLLDTLKAQIPWEAMTSTVTTVTFKRIKDRVLALKEKPDREGVLVTPLALRDQLQATDGDWRFTDAEMMTAVGHLETHGYVAVLHSSAGERYILLTPDLLGTLASSIVLLADRHPRGLGAVSETEFLHGNPFDELASLSPAESQILLDAAILRFLQHNICFRETLGSETLLIFPGMIKQKRPLQVDLPSTDDISYVVRGRVENLYASLVVLLGYTPSFTRIHQWQNQAQYEMGEGGICGFRLIEDRDGEIELVVYYGDQLSDGGRVKFQELLEQFLYQRDVEVTRFPPVKCTKGHQQKRATVIDRVRERKPFMFCHECGSMITLPDFEKPQGIGIDASPWLQREEAAARLRSAYEVQLTKVKGYRRDWAVPRCYVSHHPEQTRWAKELIRDLRDAGVYVVEQIAQVQPDDLVVVLDAPAYQKAFGTPILDGDAPLIRARLATGRRLVSLALTGRADAHEFKECKPGSFFDETHYAVGLFDLVLNLYAVPLTHAGFHPLRRALHEQWEQTLARNKGDELNSPLKIFISYSQMDETFKDELIRMLAGLQRRRIVDAWQDRRIEAGDEWYKSIQEAMNDCDLALLLISADYLASRFIQEEEQPNLLQRRDEMQLRVIPIIVRPCSWQSEPVLKDLQALPRDNKAVITFSKETGQRDQVWTDIAVVIEKHAKAKTTSTR